MYPLLPNLALTLLTIYSISLTGSDEPQVKLVQVLFRHGDRTPTPHELYPNDPHAALIQSLEPGQLTNVGKMREYNIGQILRWRYDSFLKSLYQLDEVYAYTTDTDRTKMSLQLVLAALYPPVGSQVWNQHLSWSPIPIHYVPQKIDILTSANLCPKYNEEYQKVKNMPELLEKTKSYENFSKYLSRMTNSNVTDIRQIFHIYGLLAAEKSMNLPLPKWCTDEVFQKLVEISALDLSIRSYTTELQRLNGGPLVRRFVENMNIKGDRVDPRKIYLYSAHEINLEAFLRALGITECKIPLYGSAVIMEKLQDKHNNLFVRLLLWTGVTEKLITLKLPGCKEICPMDTFLKNIHDVIPSDEEMKCHWDRLSYEDVQNVLDKI